MLSFWLHALSTWIFSSGGSNAKCADCDKVYDGQITTLHCEVQTKRNSLAKGTNGNTLVISLAEEEDAGEYVCQLSTYKPIEIKHSVKIRGKSF